jgi:hypothetical protein
MSRTRMAAVAAVMSCVLLAGGAGSAAAATQPQRLTKKLALGARVVDTKAEPSSTLRSPMFSIERFMARGEKVYAVGTFSTRLGSRKLNRTVYVPARFSNGARTSQAPPSQIPPTEGACPVLYLDLSPITLNLLGVLVRTSRIELRIEAVPGPGNLLGNLLCGLLAIIPPPTMATATPAEKAQIANAVLALAPRS